MARPRREQSDPRVIQDWINEGRGRERNGAYQPWLRIQDVASTGKSGRLTSHITGDRIVHLLSGFETYCFYIFEWGPRIVDIREQYPLLPLEETLEIARELGVDHPVSPDTRMPIVMTTDFLVTTASVQDGEEHFARDFKPYRRVYSPRTREKFEIARRYHERHRHHWGLVTDLDFPVELGRNLDFLRQKRSLAGFKGVSPKTVALVREVLPPALWKGHESLSDVAIGCDKRLGFELGTSLTVAYHLIYNREWIVDLTQRLRPGQPLALLSPRPKEAVDVLIQFPAAMEQ
jgi:hypothetical protein